MDRLRKLKNQKGFTLVELMVVVVIIGILVAIAIPIFNNVTKNAANKAHAANMRVLIGAGQQAIAVEGVPTAAVEWNAKSSEQSGKYKASEYVADWPEYPASATENPTFANTFAADHDNYKITIKDTGEVTAETYKK